MRRQARRTLENRDGEVLSRAGNGGAETGCIQGRERVSAEISEQRIAGGLPGQRTRVAGCARAGAGASRRTRRTLWRLTEACADDDHPQAVLPAKVAEREPFVSDTRTIADGRVWPEADLSRWGAQRKVSPACSTAGAVALVDTGATRLTRRARGESL